MKLFRYLLRDRPFVLPIVAVLMIGAIAIVCFIVFVVNKDKTDEVIAFEQHMEECEQCSADDPTQAMCEEGFALMQAAMKSDLDYFSK